MLTFSVFIRYCATGTALCFCWPGEESVADAPLLADELAALLVMFALPLAGVEELPQLAIMMVKRRSVRGKKWCLINPKTCFVFGIDKLLWT